MFELASPTGKSFRFVRAWRDATRDHYSVGPGAVKCGSSSSPAGVALRLGLAWLGFRAPAPAPARLCAWLLAFGFRAPASAPARSCAWLLAFVLALAFFFIFRLIFR